MSALAEGLHDDEVLWQPHAGPQTAFLLSDSYETLYGGAAGGGKTDALLAVLLEQTEHPQFKGLFLRRNFPELREVIDRTLAMWPKLGAKWNDTAKRWTFPSGATVEMGYCETYRDVQRYQGREFTVICFDELGQIAEERVWTFLMSRNRSTGVGLRKCMRASANPGGAGHAWLKRRFVLVCQPDGTPVEFTDAETREVMTRAFVAARLEDNPTLLARDPGYVARLNMLPETTRKQLREGDWSAGEGMALEELAEAVHLVRPFKVPDHWIHFGAFDWGFSHPFVFCHFVADGDGTVYLVHTVKGRRKKPHDIAHAITEQVPVDTLAYVHAGHDCFYETRARGENTPSIAEAMADHGIYMVQANIARVAGLNNLRRYIAWKTTGPGGTEGEPKFYLFDTPANRETWETLTSIVTDPLNREDALKVDANDDGEGGDDAYDTVRYGLASRPISAPALEDAPKSAWHPDVLAAEAARKRIAPTPSLRPALPPGLAEVL